MDDELKVILDTMDIPELRKTDWLWLLRNMSVRNSKHPLLGKAMGLIKQELRNKGKE